MSRRDRVDPSLASEFAWTYAPPTAPVLPELPAGPLSDRATLVAVDAYVAAVWSLVGPAVQRDATLRLAAAIEAWGFAWARARLAPFTVLRASRLVCRHRDAFEPERLAWLVFLLSLPGNPRSFHRPLIEECLDRDLELLRCPDPIFHLVLGEANRPDELLATHPTFGARLAKVVASDAPDSARALAARCLAQVRWPESEGVLRAGILDRSLTIRAISIVGLLDATPPRFTPDDLRALLVDAAERPVIVRGGSAWADATWHYDAAFARAVREVRLGGLRELLLPLLHEARAMVHFRQGLTLPLLLRLACELTRDDALPVLKELSREPEWRSRWMVVEAARSLAPKDATPFLLEAIADSHPEVATFARKVFADLTGHEAPPPGLEGICKDLLLAPPSLRLRQRLDVLRGEDAEASSRVLLAAITEAPSREALVVLLFAVGAFELHERRDHEGLPKTQLAWGELIAELFGEPALDGLMWLCERWCGRSEGAWPEALRDALHKQRPGEQVLARLRDRAGHLFATVPETHRRRLALMLVPLGVTAEALDAVWAMAMRTPGSADETCAAREAIALTPGLEIDRRLRVELDEALSNGQLTRFRSLAQICIFRRTPELRARLLELLEHPPEDDAHVKAFALVARRMARTVPIPTWITEALAHPASHRFDVAVGWVHAELWARKFRETPNGRLVVAALERALEKPDRQGRAAVAAAVPLVDAKIVDADDPRITRALAGEPELLQRLKDEEDVEDEADEADEADDFSLARDQAADAFWATLDEDDDDEPIGVPPDGPSTDDEPAPDAPIRN